MPIYTDGYGGDIYSADDTTIKIWVDGTRNGGGHGNFAPRGPETSDRERSLLRFNLSAIAARSTCNSATLYLYHNFDPESAPDPCTGNVYYVSDANGDWVAGDKNIAAADAGECCWNCKASDGAGGCNESWAGSAGCKTPGTDYDATAIGSYSANPKAAKGTETAISLDTTVVEGWFGTTNNGIILIGSNNSEIHWAQSDEATTSRRPKLVVDYTEVSSNTVTQYYYEYLLAGVS